MDDSRLAQFGAKAKTLATDAVMSRLYPWVTAYKKLSVPVFEPDGRKRAKAVRDLFGAGLIEAQTADSGGDVFLRTDFIYDLLSPSVPDLIATWEEKRDHTDCLSHSPFILPLEWFVPNQIKRLLKSDDCYLWYVCNNHPFRYRQLRFYEQASAGDDLYIPESYKGTASRYNGLWWGPMTLAEAQKVMQTNLPKDNGYSWDYVFAVSSAPFQNHVETVLFEEQVQNAFVKNYGWGFVKLGILNEEEASHVCSDANGFNINLGYCSAFPGMAHRYKGDTGLEKLEDDSLEQLSGITKRLLILKKIKHWMLDHGQSEFEKQYRELLRKELKGE